MGELVEPVLWHKLNERPLTDAEKAEFSEHGYLDFEIPEYMFDCPMPDEGRGDWDGVIAWAEMPKYYSEGK